MKPSSISPIVDTTIIQDSTADALAVTIDFDPVPSNSGTYTDQNGNVITGTFSVTPPSQTIHLSDLKSELASIDNHIAELQQEIADLMARKADLPELIDSVQTSVDTAISTAVTNGATDSRTVSISPMNAVPLTP